MRLYLHIGTEKTGTTSLQKFLAGNQQLLAERGFFYPQSPGVENHIALATVARRSHSELWDTLGISDREGWDAFRRQFRQRFSHELTQQRANAVIMSGEHCSSRLRLDEDVHRLLEFLEPFFTAITVIVYLRRQDDFLASTYSTDVKNGSTKRLGLPPQEEMAFRYDYWELLSRWARVFGRENIVARRYGKSFLTEGNIVDDFLGILGLDGTFDVSRPKIFNESLDAECLEFLRLLNAHLSPSDQRRGIVSALQALSTGPLVDLPPGQMKEFMDGLAEANRRVALEYFGGVTEAPGDPLFGTRQDERPRTSPPDLTAERAVGITAQIFAELRRSAAKPQRVRKG